MLKERIKNDLKEALKEQRKAEILALRLLLASILNKEKEKRYKLSKERPELGEKDLEKESELKDEEVLEAISSEVKKRKEAILEFERGKRIDLAEKERMELEILQKYLPEQLSEEEIKKIATSAIEEIGAKESKDIGRVMAQLMPKLKGRADSSFMSGKTFSKSWAAVILIAFLAGGILIWQYPLFERILQDWWLPEQAEIKVSLDQAFKLRVNQTAFIQEENIKIKFLEVAQDSRCPSDVQCVWQGQVTVVVNILKNDRNLGNFDLTLLVGKEWLETKTFDGYSIKLTKVEPYPKSDETIEFSDYVITLVVSKTITFSGWNWKTYNNDILGIEFEYPAELGEVTFTVSPDNYYGEFSNSELLRFGSVTLDFSKGREGLITDSTGYVVKDSRFYLKRLKKEISVLPEKVLEVTEGEAIILTCQSFGTCGEEGPVLLNDLARAGVINLKRNNDFPGIVIYTSNTQQFPAEIFDRIIKSIKVLD